MKNQLIKVFNKKNVLTIVDLKNYLQTNSRMTVFRKLKQLPYKSSYSHCGKYYTLDGFAKYNKNGIWGYNQIYFSKYGTLKSTVLKNIEGSKSGLSSFELEGLLHVPAYNAALGLFKAHKVARKQIGKEYIYLSLESGNAQSLLREQEIQQGQTAANDEMDEYLTLFMLLLDEKQKRLFAGFESLKLGYGGDKKIAAKTGLNAKTVSRGRRELLSKDIGMSKVRKIGAGRPSLKKTKKF